MVPNPESLWRNETIRSIAIHLVAGMVIIAGCDTAASRKPTLAEQIEDKNAQIIAQKAEIDALRSHLSAIEKYGSLDLPFLVYPGRVEFGRYTRIEHNKLIAYLIVFDAEGDSIKSYGRIDLNLLQRSGTASGKNLKTWEFDLQTARDHWLGGPLSNHYKFVLDIPEGTPRNSLALSACFTDPLTGTKLMTDMDLTPAR